MAVIQSHREMKSRTLEYPNLLQSSCLHHCHLLLPTIHKFHEVLFYGAQVLPFFFAVSVLIFVGKGYVAAVGLLEAEGGERRRLPSPGSNFSLDQPPLDSLSN